MGAISSLYATLTPTPYVIPISDGSGLLDDWVTPGLTNPMTTDQDLIVGGIAGAAGRLGVGSHGQVLTVGSSGIIDWETPSSSGGTVTTLSVVSANGFAGSVANPTTTPAITLSTTITGIIKGNGTAISAASAGTDYVAPGAIITSGLTMATAKMLGRATAGTGAIEEIAVTGSGSAVLATSPTLVTPALGTPSAIVLTNGTGLPIAGITGLGSGIATWLATPSSANLAAAITDETGSGLLVFGTAPTFASTMTVGTASGTTGAINFKGTTSGTVTFSVADAAGTNTFKLPATAGSNTNVLATDGSGNLFWQAAGTGTGTVNSGTATNIAYYASTGTAISGSANITISSTGRVGIAPTLTNSGVVPYLTITAPVDTLITAGTEGIGISFVAAGRQHASNSNVGKQREIVLTAPTYSFATLGGTITVAATLAIEAAPIAGTAATLTNTFALWLQAGSIGFGDGIAGANLGIISQSGGSLTISSLGGLALRPSYNANGNLSIAGAACDVVISDDTAHTTWFPVNPTGRGLYLQRAGNSASLSMCSVNTTASVGIDGYGATGTYASPAAMNSGSGNQYRLISYGGTTWVNNTSVQLLTTQTQSETARGSQIVFRTTPNNSVTIATVLTLDQDATATFASSIKTGAPSGGTAGAWKTGILVTAAVTPDVTRYIQLDVGGTTYKLIIST